MLQRGILLEERKKKRRAIYSKILETEFLICYCLDGRSIVLSKTSVTSSTCVKSSRNATRSVSSVSCGSLNHVETGTALALWKI